MLALALYYALALAVMFWSSAWPVVRTTVEELWRLID